MNKTDNGKTPSQSSLTKDKSVDNLFVKAKEVEISLEIVDKSNDTFKVEDSVRESSPYEHFKKNLSPLISKLSSGLKKESLSESGFLLPPAEYNIRGGRFLTLVLNLDEILICTK